MSRYLWLYFSFFRASVMSDVEYRLNIAMKVFTDVLWYAAQLSVFEVLYSHVDAVSGWTIDKIRVFMGLLFLVDALWMILFHENFERLSQKIRRGELDLLLVKPIDAQFMITMQKQNTSYVVNVLFTLAYLGWALSQVVGGVEIWRLIFLLVAIPSGLAIMYSMRLGFSLMSVIFTNADSLNYVFYQIYRLGMRPDAIYPFWLRWVVLSILPVGFVVSVPARLVLEPSSWVLVLVSLAVAVAAILFSRFFWAFAMRRYASASS